jgi:hypothetical protein
LLADIGLCSFLKLYRYKRCRLYRYSFLYLLLLLCFVSYYVKELSQPKSLLL